MKIACQPEVYAFYASGRTVFQVLSGYQVLANNCWELLDEVYISDQDELLQSMCQRSARYSAHPWEERFANLNS